MQELNLEQPTFMLQSDLYTLVQKKGKKRRFYPLWMFGEDRTRRRFVQIMRKSWDKLKKEGWHIEPCFIMARPSDVLPKLSGPRKHKRPELYYGEETDNQEEADNE